HDITAGSNGDYSAGVGYDVVTGLGSFDATNLLAAAGGATTTTLATSTTTTTTAPPTTTTTAAPTSTTTTTTAASTTTTTSSTSTTTSSTTTTTLGSPCLPAGATCGRPLDCCSATCRGKPGQRTCK